MVRTELLTVGNPKTIKGEKNGILTAILMMSPYDIGGIQVCPFAKLAGCHKACLNLAGRGGMIAKGKRTNKVQKARLRRKMLWKNNRDIFVLKLRKEIKKLKLYSEKNGFIFALRLNGISDINWHEEGLIDDIKDILDNVILYDYTKDFRRLNKELNYHLTYSYSPKSNLMREKAVEYLKTGGNVAVTFSTKGKQRLPLEYMGYRVIDGDNNDFRPNDGKGVIVGLRFKGTRKRLAQGIKDGFVVKI